MDKIKILLAEDEAALAFIIKESLETRNFAVTIAANGREAVQYFRTYSFDALVLDVMMPEMDGFTLTQEIRRTDRQIPVVMLTAKSQTADVVQGFKSGANDYLKKPFSMEELIVRIEALLERVGSMQPNTVLDIGTYAFDWSRQVLQSSLQTHSLTFMEARLLLLLAEHRNEVVARSRILRDIWGSDNFFNGRSLDVFITKLRKKLAGDPGVKIINSRGYGYKIVY